jgi:hypothetical protein
MDCHALWHAVDDSYMEPDGFRLHLNSLIQALRNVTWLLQKQKSSLRDFDAWYSEWKASIADDPVLRWVIKARNRIVKESDLELLSEATVRYLGDWLNEHEMTMQLPARFTTHQIMDAFIQSPRLPNRGLLRVDRQWIDRLLPETEILEATSHAFFAYEHLLLKAHTMSGVSSTCHLPSRKPPCVTSELRPNFHECMRNRGDQRRLTVSLDERRRVEGELRVWELNKDADLSSQLKERYGEAEAELGRGDAIARVPGFMQMARRVVSVDKHHVTMAWMFRDERIIEMFPLVFDDYASKRLGMDAVAERVDRLNANGLVFVTEVWIAPLGENEDWTDPKILPARERPDRREAINVIGVTKNGARVVNHPTFQSFRGWLRHMGPTGRHGNGSARQRSHQHTRAHPEILPKPRRFHPNP